MSKIWQISTTIHGKSSEETRIIRTYINTIKIIYSKPVANIDLNGERVKYFH